MIVLGQDEWYLTACEERGRAADVASMRPLLRNIRRAGFAGPVYAVNPHPHAIEHTPCFPAVTALPRTPELAVLAVPARAGRARRGRGVRQGGRVEQDVSLGEDETVSAPGPGPAGR